MEDETPVEVREIENCIGSISEEEHENLAMQPEVISFVIVRVGIHAIKRTKSFIQILSLFGGPSVTQRPNGKIGSRLFVARIVEVYLGNHDSIEKNIQGEPYEHGAMAVLTDCE